MPRARVQDRAFEPKMLVSETRSAVYMSKMLRSVSTMLLLARLAAFLCVVSAILAEHHAPSQIRISFSLHMAAIQSPRRCLDGQSLTALVTLPSSILSSEYATHTACIVGQRPESCFGACTSSLYLDPSLVIIRQLLRNLNSVCLGSQHPKL